MGACFSSLLRRFFGGPPVAVPDEEQGVPVHHGFVQNSSEGCQTTPAISVESKDMRMLVFAKCLSLDRTDDTVRVTVYYTDEDTSTDAVKDAAAMEANKHAGRLVGQSPVFIYNNEKHVLVEIGDVILPSSVISEGSKVTDLLHFKRIWKRHNGQSSTLVLKRGNRKEKGVNFKVTFKQGEEIVVDIHVVEELRHLITNPERALPSHSLLDSGIVTSSEDQQDPRVGTATSDSDDQDYRAQGARPKQHLHERKRKKKKYSPRQPHRTPNSQFKRRCEEESYSEETDRRDDSYNPRRRAEQGVVSSSKASSRPGRSKTVRSEDPVPGCSHASQTWYGTSDTEETVVASKTSDQTVKSNDEQLQVTDNTETRKMASQGESSHQGQSQSGQVMNVPPVASASAVEDILSGLPQRAQNSMMQIVSDSAQTDGYGTVEEHDPEFDDYAIISPMHRNNSYTDSGIHSAAGSFVMVVQNLSISQQSTTVHNSNPAIQNTELFESDRFPEVLLEPLKQLDLGDWKMLASKLHLDRFIKGIEIEVKNHDKSPMRLLMDKFWQIKGNKEDGLSRLKAALQSMEQIDVFEQLQDAEKDWATHSRSSQMEHDG